MKRSVSTTLRLGMGGLVAAALATTATVPAQAAPAAERPSGNRSLAKVLAADGNHFDRKWQDFDILDRAVRTVLKANPDSPVKLLTQGRKRATAFLPTDRAFRVLVRDLTGKAPRTEKATFKAVASVAGVETLEAVLLYHVVPGKTLGAKKVLAANGSSVKTALGEPITIKVRNKRVVLVDLDRDDRNARVVVTDINKGNKQIAHAINRVLRPIDLP